MMRLAFPGGLLRRSNLYRTCDIPEGWLFEFVDDVDCLSSFFPYLKLHETPSSSQNDDPIFEVSPFFWGSTFAVSSQPRTSACLTWSPSVT